MVTKVQTAKRPQVVGAQHPSVRKAMIQQQLSAALSSVVEAGTVISEMEEDLTKQGVSRNASTTSTAEWAVLYSYVDGTTSRCRVEWLLDKLQMVDPKTGDPVWTVEPRDPSWQYQIDGILNMPMKVNARGVMCLLAPDHPERQTWDAIGLEGRVCHKTNIPTELALQNHLEKKHEAEWKVIQRYEDRVEKDALRRNQELLSQGIAALLSAQAGGKTIEEVRATAPPKE